jgi:hypothetical protein
MDIPWGTVFQIAQGLTALALQVAGKPGNSLHDVVDPVRLRATLPPEHCATLAQLGALCAPPDGGAPHTLVPDPPAGG